MINLYLCLCTLVKKMHSHEYIQIFFTEWNKMESREYHGTIIYTLGLFFYVSKHISV